MTPEQLMADALGALSDGSFMSLVIPRGYKRPKGFPRGELLCDNEGSGLVYSFDPTKILKWLELNGISQKSPDEKDLA